MRRPSRDHEAGGAALVHDFFVQDGGAESCAIELARLMPSASIHTTFFDADRFGARIAPDRVHPWPLQRLLGPTSHFRSLLPLYPIWFNTLDLRDKELVISSSVAFAKAVRTSRRALHVSYVYTPLRYAWDLDRYLARGSYGPVARIGARTLRPLLRRWDVRTGGTPDIVVAISREVRERIWRLWRRDAEVIYPPVDTSAIGLSRADDGYYLVAARLLAYRRIDLAIEACRLLNRELVVVGDGPERRRLEAQAAQSPYIRLLGHVDRSVLLDLFARCHAYLLTGVEDFGIAPLEAASAGKPVVAYRGGGALETVLEGETGIFFDHANAASLAAAIQQLDEVRLDPTVIRRQAERFDRGTFVAAWVRLLTSLSVDPRLYSAS